jgi:hypothetical protein
MDLIIRSLVAFALTMSLSSCTKAENNSDTEEAKQLISKACLTSVSGSDKSSWFLGYKSALTKAVKLDPSYRDDYEASIIAYHFVKGQQVDLALANTAMARLEALCTLVMPE